MGLSAQIVFPLDLQIEVEVLYVSPKCALFWSLETKIQFVLDNYSQTSAQRLPMEDGTPKQ